MRQKKTLPRDQIVKVYGNWAGARVDHYMFTKKNPNRLTYYYYRHKGKWYPTTFRNLVKRGIAEFGEE